MTLYTNPALEASGERPEGHAPRHDAPRGPGHQSGAHRNVGWIERMMNIVGGSALALYGLRRASPGGLALTGLGAALVARGASGYCPMYQALDIDRAHDYQDGEQYFQRGIQVIEAMTIQRPRSELYQFWHNLENLPRFMKYLESVEDRGDGTSRWRAKGPAGSTVQWDARIINDEPDTLIAWESLRGGDIDTAGSVRFLDAPSGRGTEVHVNLQYIPPAGKLGSAVAYLFGRHPQQEIHEDLGRFKQLMEAGEIATTEGQPRGTAC